MTITNTRLQSRLATGENKRQPLYGDEMSELDVPIEELSSKVVYRIFCSADAGESSFSRVYSISADMIAGGKTVDSALVYDVTRSRLVAMELLMKISRNRVTPCTLADVISDHIA